MATFTKYPTRAMETWAKLKELRRKYNRLGWEARENGGAIVASQMPSQPLLCGVGLWGRRLYGPYFAKAMKELDRLNEYHAAADAKGFPRGEMCSSMHHYVGELLTGDTTLNPWTGERSPVDFVFESEFCPSVGKTAQFAAEQLGVPLFTLDIPQTGDEAAVEYVRDRLHEAITFLTRVTGKPFDDERLVEATINWWDQGVISGRIFEAARAIPAPVDLPMLHEIEVAGGVGGYSREIVDLLAEILSELEERTRDGISVYGVETVRLNHEGEHFWYARDFVPDLVRRYGGVIVGGNTGFAMGIYDLADGYWVPAPRFSDLGVSLRTRDDAIGFLARCYVLHSPAFRLACLEERVRMCLKRAQNLRCDGVIFHMDIGCRSEVAGNLEARALMEKAGIPTVTYQGMNSDAMNFSPQQVASPLESFLERLGLRPLE